MVLGASDQQQNGALPRGPLPDIQENEPLNPQPSSDVKVSIRDNSITDKQSSLSIKIVGPQLEQEKKRLSKPPKSQLERFLITTCILLSSCVCILLLLLMVQAYFTGECNLARISDVQYRYLV